MQVISKYVTGFHAQSTLYVTSSGVDLSGMGVPARADLNQMASIGRGGRGGVGWFELHVLSRDAGLRSIDSVRELV